MTWTWAEPFAGAAACALRLVGGPGLTPPVAWMGGKRRLAHEIVDAMGVPEGPPSRVLLADAGPWGWVWPLLLAPASAADVARVLRSWAGEHPRDLWQRLAAVPPAEDLHERAAQWLWLQARAPSGVPVWFEDWRWVSGNGKPATDRGEDMRWPGHQALRATWRMGEEFAKSRRGDRTISQAGTARGRESTLTTSLIGDRLEAIADAFRGVLATVHHGSAAECGEAHRRAALPMLPTHGGWWVYIDPPYVGATGYGWTLPRAEVLALARRWHEAGAVVAVSEAEPLTLDGWHHVKLTREGGKPEWLTLSREPGEYRAWA